MLNSQVHNEIEMEDMCFDNKAYFSLDSYEIKGASDIKFISCLYLYGDTLYIGTRSSKLYIYTIDSSPTPKLTNMRIVVPHCETVSHIAASRRFFVTAPECDDEASVRIWDAKSLLFEVSLKGHQSQVSKVMFLNDNDYVVTSSWDNSVKVWLIKKMKEDAELLVNETRSEYPVLVVEEVRESILAFGGDDCYITIWNYQINATLGKVFGHAGSVTYLLMENGFLMSAGGDCKVKMWEVSDKIHLAVGKKSECDDSDNSERMVNNRSSSKLPITEQKPQVMGEAGDQQAEKKKEERVESEGKVKVVEVPEYLDENVAKLRSEFKMSYDASVYMAYLTKNKQKFFIDRHGNGFIMSGSSILEGENRFSYGVNVTGVVSYGEYLYISTTKGEIKRCTIVRKGMNEGEDEPMQM